LLDIGQNQSMDNALGLGRHLGSITGMLLIDLDRFKEVNDTLGRHCGNSLLDQIGKRLISEAREIDTFARLNDDEFASLPPSVEGLEGAWKAAQRLHTAITASFEINGIELDVEASFEVVVSGMKNESASS